MLFQSGIKQAFRSPVRTVVLFVILVLICGFLSIGLNLRQAAQDNIQLLKEEFDVVAVPTFKGSVDNDGNLITAEDTRNMGFYTIYARNFDTSVFENAAGVKAVIIHSQFGATVNSEEYLYPGRAIDQVTQDVIVFTYKGKEPVTIGGFANQSEVTRLINTQTFHLDWSARGYQELEYSDEGIRVASLINKQQWMNEELDDLFEDPQVAAMWPLDAAGHRIGAFTLYPGQQYIATCHWNMESGDKRTGRSSKLFQLIFEEDPGHRPLELLVANNMNADHVYNAFHTTYPPILPYTEDFWETDAGQYYTDAVEICRVNGKALTAVATSDLSLYAPFYNEGVYISKGRTFEPDDYENGKKVCLVSEFIALQNGWEIGDKLDLSFFDAFYGFTGYARDVDSLYEPLVEHYDPVSETYTIENVSRFFDEGGLYEIVGFYDGNVQLSEWDTGILYTQDTGIDRRVVIVPEKSVQSLPEVPLSQYNTTILLDDEQILYFMADMEASGLLEQQLGQYQVSFEIFDQGLGQIKQSLRQLDTVSRLTLYLACAAAVAVVILLSVLTVIQNRRQIATLRSLGVRKHQIPAAVLSGVLLVCLLGACLGGYIGYKASDKVAGYILETAQQDMADTSFSAMLAGDTEAKEEAYTIAIQSRPQAAIFAAAAVMLSLTILSCVLALNEAQKSPMLTLGARE